MATKKDVVGGNDQPGRENQEETNSQTPANTVETTVSGCLNGHTDKSECDETCEPKSRHPY